MRVLKTLLKCIIILVVLFLLSAAESLADWFASNINGEDSIEINPFTEALLDELES